MADETQSLMLGILKDVQSRLIGLSGRMDNWEVRQENLTADNFAIRRDGLRQDETIAHLHLRQDRMEAAVDRINTRLGLIDTDVH